MSTAPFHMDHADAVVFPPTECPVLFKPGADRWGEEVRTLFRQLRVPWSIQSGISHETTSSLVDLANRFTNLDDVVASVPRDLGFAQNTPPWNANHFRAAMSHFKEAWERARLTRDQRRSLDAKAADDDPTHTMVPGQRESMERAYHAKTGFEPEPEHQGSDYLLGKLHRDCARGRLGSYTTNEITSMIPEPHVVLKRVAKQTRTSDGTMREHDAEFRDPPYTMDQWKRQMKVWMVSLLMAIASHPHQLHLQITKTELEEFYDWLWGPDVMGRENPPSLQSQMYAERLAWGRISIMIHKKVTLSEAIKKIQSNNMFWQKEVADRCPKRDNVGKGKGRKGQGLWSSPQNDQLAPTPYRTPKRQRSRTPKGGKGQGNWSPYTPPPMPPSSWGGANWQGKAKKGKKGKGQSKGQWVSVNIKGEQYCWAWNGGNCSNPNCSRVHRCCVGVGKSGQGCNKNHPASSH